MCESVTKCVFLLFVRVSAFKSLKACASVCNRVFACAKVQSCVCIFQCVYLCEFFCVLCVFFVLFCVWV